MRNLRRDCRNTQQGLRFLPTVKRGGDPVFLAEMQPIAAELDWAKQRKAWRRLPYRSQHVARRDRPFEKLFRLQRKLGSIEGWEAGLRRPKGMWRRTYERHWERYLELDAECGQEMAAVFSRVGERF